MDAEIRDIMRRAGILEEATFDMASHETLLQQVQEESDFLNQLGQVLGRAMAPDRARRVLGVIGQRRNMLQQRYRTIQADAQKQGKGQGQGRQDDRQRAAADAYADTDAATRQGRSYGTV